MKCPNCGVESSGKFCVNCGAPLEESPIAREQRKTARKKKKSIFQRVWFWVIAGLVLLVIIVGSLGGQAQSASVPAQGAAEPSGAAKMETPPDAGANGAAAPAKAEAVSDEITVEERVLFEQNGVRVTLKGLDMEGSIFGPALKVLVENDGEKSVTVQVRNVSINDIMVESMFSCEVAGGKKANDEITFMSSALETAGVTVFQQIELSFHVFDTDNWETIMDSEPITIATSADPSLVQAIDDGGTVAMDQDGIRVIVKKLDNQESFWGADVYVYVENTSDQNVTVQVRDVSINGFMIDPMFSCDVPSGKKAFDSITFMQSDLDDNGIKDISSIELNFHIFNMDTWDTVLDTEKISLSF